MVATRKGSGRLDKRSLFWSTADQGVNRGKGKGGMGGRFVSREQAKASRLEKESEDVGSVG